MNYGTYVTTTTYGNYEPIKPKKKPSKIKVVLFSMKWHWKNRKWKNCRHKRRAFETALMKQGLWRRWTEITKL